MSHKAKTIAIAYWSSRNLGVLDNIIRSFQNKGFRVKELQFRHLKDTKLNNYFRFKSNKNILNLFSLVLLGIRLNFLFLRYKRVYLFGTGLPLFCPFFIRRKKLVCHYNEVPKFFDAPGQPPARYERTIFNMAASIVVSNEFRKDLFMAENPSAAYFILDNVLHFRFYEQPMLYAAEIEFPVKLLYSGAIGKSREVISLVKAVKQNVRLELTIVGDVDNSYYHSFMAEIGNAANIHYLGKVPFEKALELTSQTDFGLAFYNLKDHNNRYCAPVKIHEFFLFGKPVISLENPPLVKIAQDYGIVFPLKAISDLMNDDTATALRNFRPESESFRTFNEECISKFRGNVDYLLEKVYS